ncbi:MAG: hypothetical protein C4297_02890 [Gemmataceae bacterium]
MSAEPTARRRIPVKLHRPVTVLIAREEWIAREIESNKNLSGLLGAVVAPCVFAVRPQYKGRLLDQLRRLGYAPQVRTR